MKKVKVIIGSLRKESLNRKVAKELIKMAPKDLEMEIVEIGDLPHYNEDIDGENPPESYTAFREKIKSAEAVLFVTPEYNRSFSGVIKNALDVGSRPYGKNVWDGKKGGVVSVSMSNIAAFGANHHLRQSMVFLNVNMMQQPEAYIGAAHTLFDNEGNLNNEDTKKFLQNFIDAFAQWVK